MFEELIKLKAIYELLETITDKCEDVANVIEGIVLETPDQVPNAMDTVQTALWVVVLLVVLAWRSIS